MKLRAFLWFGGPVLALAGSALADTVTLHPTANGYQNNGVRSGSCTANWDCVNDQTSNAASGTPASPGNTTYLTLAGGNDTDAFALTTSGNIPSGSTVTGLDVYAVGACAVTGTCAFQVLYRVGTTSTFSGDINRTSTTFSAGNNNWTGLSLAESSWSTLQVGALASDANPDVRISQVFVVVTYTPANSTPTATIANPVNLGVIGGPAASYTIDGTASDADGTVATVDVQIQRGTEYWSGSGWTTTATWVPATGTTAWSYSWSWTSDMDATFVTVRTRATDNLGATGTATNTTTVDTRAPQIATGVRFQTLPTSGDTAFALLSNWTEANAGTPRFGYNLNNTGYTAYTNGSAGNASSKSYTVTLTGSDYFTGIRSDHTDTFANGPTTSTDSGPIYVLPLTPSAPTVANNGTPSSLNVTVAPNPGEAGAGMLYAIRCHDAGGTPTGFWVASGGRQCTAATADWQSASTWGTPVVVSGLAATTQYGFSVAAGNPGDATPTTGERSASAYGSTASATTSSANTAPTVSITSPTNGASFGQGATVTFTGTASDAEDGNLTANLGWTSSLDGAIGSGGSFTKNNLSVGTHTITASVTDSGSLTGQAQVSITINATVPGVTVAAPTAAINACTQITVQVAFTGDTNGDSTTLFERSANGTSGWTAVTSCGTNGVVGGASPRTCVDTTVAASSVNYYRVDFTDLDGVTGTDPSAAIGPYDTTSYCGVAGTTVNTPEAEGSSCSQITVLARFGGDDDRDGWTQVESSAAGAGTWTVACAKLTGGSPRQCIVPGLAASTAYDVRVDYTDGDGVANGTGTDPQTLASISTRACGADGTAPTLLVLAPARDAVVTGTDRVKVQVYDAVGATSVQWSVDQTGDTGLAAAAVNANYDCGTSCAVYEFDLATAALSVGSHYLTIKATDAAGNIARLSHAFRKNAAGGDGRLLRRTRGAQLCIDCHNLKTHSSQTTSGKYGNWAVGCDACHTPHRTKNIFLIREEIQTPNSDRRAVRFEVRSGAVNNTKDLPGAASFANEDAGTAGVPAAVDGPCQVCHTRTANPNDGNERWRNSAQVPNNADNHYDFGRPTQRCTNCHSHDAGFSGAGGVCNACHNAPPSVGKHARHDEVGSLPSDYAADTSHATATQYGFACAECHSNASADHFPVEGAPYTVDVLFKGTAPANPGAIYNDDGGSRTTDPGVNGDGWYWSNGTCSNVYCHSDADRIGGVAYQSVTWNQGAALTCVSCHDDGGATSTLSGAHAKHTTATTYNLGCVRCHDATLDGGVNDIAPAAVADKTQHVNGVRTLVFDPSGANNSGGSYSQEPGYSCSNTYCHSNGQDRSAPYTSGPSIAWNATAAADCTSCHAGNAGAAATMGSGRHSAHVNNLTSGGGVLGVNFECAACHAATVTVGNDRAITDPASHVNFAADVSGTLTDNSYVSPTCNNAYCHSSGQATPEYYSPSWTSGALDCKGCHGNHSSPAFTSQFGEPNYASGGAGAATANSHQKHVTSASDCARCHDGTTATGTAIKSGSTLHTNQARNVVIAAAYRTAGDGSSNYTPGGGTPKSCNNVACHGTGTPQWGATLVCLNCHTGTEGGALGDGTPNAVDDQWTQGTAGGGHGGSRGGTLASTLGGCDYCHQLDAGHTPTAATNPYRLRFGQTDNTLCLQCHATGDSGISQNSAGSGLTPENSGLNVDTAHYGTKHDGTEGGKLCWDCHDPHGVPTNILMVKPSVSKLSNAYGVPTTTVTVSFTDNTTPGQAVGRFTEATNSPRRGLCQACHDPSGQGASGPTKYWRSDGTDDPDGPGGSAPVTSVHNAAATCTTCHFHEVDFKGAGGDCLGCHSSAGQAGTNGANSRRPVLADFGNQSHHVGASVNAAGAALYAQPTMGGALTNYDCVVCHAEGKLVDDTQSNAQCTGSGAPYACCTGSGTGTCKATDTTGQPHQDGIIHLRNADSAATYFAFNKDQTGGIQTGAPTPGSWNSGTQTWREWTSGVDEVGGATLPTLSGDLLGAGLDRFCLSCHDSNGAVVTFNSGASEKRGFTGSASNPFADSAVSNEVDQLTRPGPVNIADMVAVGSCASYPGVYCRQNSDCPGSTTCNVNTANETGTPRGANSIPDPPDGIYSRHAIRGKSASVYTTTTPNLDNTTYWTNTTTWNSTSVMGCADCHTTDGANTTSGNAHGSGSEYLLKDASGTANEGTASGVNYVCFACHKSTLYSNYATHTDSGQNDIDTTSAIGGSRTAGDGTIFGMACTNCHGGAPGNVGTFQAPTTPEAAAKGFGRIHGSSSIFSVPSAGACVGGSNPGALCTRAQDCTGGGTCTGTVTQRQAYRFMNGGGLRYFAPGGWSYSKVSCYTLGAGDSWSSCSHHSTGTVFTKPVQRTLNY